MFVGYGKDITGYIIYFPEKQKVEAHRDIIFLPENNKMTEKLDNILEEIQNEERVESLSNENSENNENSN